MARDFELKCSTVIRLSVDTATALKDIAARNMRSMNNQVIYYVEQGLAQERKERPIEEKT